MESEERVRASTELVAKEAITQAKNAEKLPDLRNIESSVSAQLHRLNVENENLEVETNRIRETIDSSQKQAEI